MTIYVATGKSAVPNLSGLTLADAKTYASDQGFSNVVVAGERGGPRRTRRAPIVNQDPQPGKTALRTDPVKVYIAKAPSTPSATATSSSSFTAAPPSASASESSTPTASASPTPSNG